MSAHNRIEGIFRLRTPLHCASGEKLRNEQGNENGNATMKQPIVGRTGIEFVPYFPANDLGGRLRREGARAVMSALLERGIKVDRELFTGLNSGSADASPDTASITVEEIERGRRHIFQGVFGGGARMLRKRIRLSDLYPVLQCTIEGGQVPESLSLGQVPMVTFGGDGRPADGRNLQHTPMMLRKDDILTPSRPEDLLAFIDGGLPAISDYQAETLADRQERKDSKAAAKLAKANNERVDVAKKKEVSNMYAVEAIAAGTRMYFRLDLADDLDDAQVGLVARSLVAMINRQDLGGMVRNGFGRYAADLTLVRHGNVSPLLQADGDAYTLAGEALSYQAATSEALSALQIDELREFYKPRAKAQAEAEA